MEKGDLIVDKRIQYIRKSLEKLIRAEKDIRKRDIMTLLSNSFVDLKMSNLKLDNRPIFSMRVVSLEIPNEGKLLHLELLEENFKEGEYFQEFNHPIMLCPENEDVGDINLLECDYLSDILQTINADFHYLYEAESKASIFAQRSIKVSSWGVLLSTCSILIAIHLGYVTHYYKIFG